MRSLYQNETKQKVENYEEKEKVVFPNEDNDNLSNKVVFVWPIFSAYNLQQVFILIKFALYKQLYK